MVDKLNMGDFFLRKQKNRDFREYAVSNSSEHFFVMNNSKLFVSAICVLGLTLAAPFNTEAGRSGGNRGDGGRVSSAPRGGGFAHGSYARGVYPRGGYARGGYGYPRTGYSRSAYARGARAPGNYARAGQGPNGSRTHIRNGVRTSASNRNWNGHNALNSAGGRWRNSNGKWGWWNGNRWCYPRNNVVFIGGLGFPWWWGWGWGPWAGWGWGSGYPYGYYGYGDSYGYDYPYYGYGNGYSAEYQSPYANSRYSNSSESRVAELQRRLSRAGYYNGSIDGVLGPQTRRAIRDYEQAHGDVG